MLRVTLRSVWDHKRRLISTIVAIVLGVAFVSGTFVLTDTLDKVFDDLFATANEEVATQVQGTVLFSDPLGGDQRALLDPAILDTVRAVDGVASAVPFVRTIGFASTNRVLDPTGKAVGSSQGPPTLIESWIDDPDLTVYELAEGRGPMADGEIALNVAAADEAGFDVGDPVTLVGQSGTTQYTLVGLVTFGTAKSSAGAVSAEFTLAETQRLAGTDGKLNEILARANPGISDEELTARIGKALPDNAEAITGAEAAAQLSKNVQSGFGFFTIILSIFGGVALLVGVFVISNTFSILVAQRTRELALLRAVGASRAQVLRSVLAEATLVGLIAAVLGLGAGIGLAKAVTAILSASGASLPTTSLLVRPSTVVLAFVLGLAVTISAAMVPAIRATRVPPLAALRDVSIDRSGASRVRIGIGAIVLLVGAFQLSAAWRDGTSGAVPAVGVGALLLIVGSIVIGPLAVGPSVRILGWPLAAVRGVTGKLAVENARRSPKRTSATASALVIGVALVGFITVFAASAKRSVTAEVERGFNGDFIVQSSSGGFGPPSGIPSTVADAVRAVPGVDVVTSFGFERAQFTYPQGKVVTQFITSIDPVPMATVFRPRMTQGRITDLRDDGIVVDKQLAEVNRVKVGDRMQVTVNGGGTLDLTIQAISDDQTLLGYFTITRATFASVAPEVVDLQVIGSVKQGFDKAAVITEVEQAVSSTPLVEVLDREGFIGDLASQITQFVTFIYGLLIMSIIIALIGIANTLSLSINERTRELGLLRAVGMHRGQMRSLVRWEAVLISVLGTVIGLTLGLLMSRAMIASLGTQGLTRFSVPVGSLVTIMITAALLGTAASILPARRAGRLTILDAIAEE